MNQIPSYIINLGRRPDRLVKSLYELDKLNITPQWAPGLSPTADGGKLLNHKRTKQKGAVVGCALAHMEVYDKISRGEDEWGLIFEDDIHVMAEASPNLLNYGIRQSMSMGADVILLGYCPRQSLSKVWEDGNLTIQEGYAVCMHAYLMSRHACRVFLDHLDQNGMKDPHDVELAHLCRKGVLKMHVLDLRRVQNGHMYFGKGLIRQNRKDLGSDIRKLRMHRGTAIPTFSDRPGTKTQKDLRTLLLKASRALNHSGVNYVVGFGTLLGLYRDGDIIPGDNDVDILVSPEDTHMLRTIKWRKFGLHLAVINEKWDRGYQQKEEAIKMKKKLRKLSATDEMDAISLYRLYDRGQTRRFVDLYIMDEVEGRLHTRVSRDFCKTFCPKQLYPRQGIMIDNVMTYLPAQPEPILTQLYGDFMTPSPEKGPSCYHLAGEWETRYLDQLSTIEVPPLTPPDE